MLPISPACGCASVLLLPLLQRRRCRSGCLLASAAAAVQLPVDTQLQQVLLHLPPRCQLERGQQAAQGRRSPQCSGRLALQQRARQHRLQCSSRRPAQRPAVQALSPSDTSILQRDHQLVVEQRPCTCRPLPGPPQPASCWLAVALAAPAMLQASLLGRRWQSRPSQGRRREATATPPQWAWVACMACTPQGLLHCLYPPRRVHAFPLPLQLARLHAWRRRSAAAQRSRALGQAHTLAAQLMQRLRRPQQPPLPAHRPPLALLLAPRSACQLEALQRSSQLSQLRCQRRCRRKRRLPAVLSRRLSPARLRLQPALRLLLGQRAKQACLQRDPPPPVRPLSRRCLLQQWAQQRLLLLLLLPQLLLLHLPLRPSPPPAWAWCRLDLPVPALVCRRYSCPARTSPPCWPAWPAPSPPASRLRLPPAAPVPALASRPRARLWSCVGAAAMQRLPLPPLRPPLPPHHCLQQHLLQRRYRCRCRRCHS